MHSLTVRKWIECLSSHGGKQRFLVTSSLDCVNFFVCVSLFVHFVRTYVYLITLKGLSFFLKTNKSSQIEAVKWFKKISPWHAVLSDYRDAAGYACASSFCWSLCCTSAPALYGCKREEDACEKVRQEEALYLTDSDKRLQLELLDVSLVKDGARVTNNDRSRLIFTELTIHF